MAQNIKNLTKNQNWETETITNSDLQTSALMRMADACETQTKYLEMLAKKNIQMEKDLDYYKSGYQRRGEEINRLERSKSALKGIITKLQNKNA